MRSVWARCMPPADLRAWQSAMGYTQARAAESLGVALGTYKDWITGHSRTTGNPIAIDRRTSLACAAIAAGLSEWVPAVV